MSVDGGGGKRVGGSGQAWVAVWRIRLDGAPPAAAWAVLSLEERERAGRFAHAVDTRRFVQSHAATRAIVGRELGLAAGGVRFRLGPWGKPFADDPTALRFNVSHAGEWALVAVAWGRELGVDVEVVRPERATDDVVRHFFSPAEVAAFFALPPEARCAAFFRCWTRKESFIKATGEGFSADLAGFDVSLAPGEPARLLATRPDGRGPTRWVLFDVEVGPEYAAALTVEGPCAGVRIHDLDDLAGLLGPAGARS